MNMQASDITALVDEVSTPDVSSEAQDTAARISALLRHLFLYDRGNVLRVIDLALDCDGDAVLVTADPAGATCHRGTRSCFDPEGAPAARATQGFAWLETLWSTIASRAAERPSGSYTTELLDGGVDAAGRKVTEEATEVLLAAKDDATASTDTTRAALAGEAADLLYHALVLLAERGVPPAEVVATLRSRHTA